MKTTLKKYRVETRVQQTLSTASLRAKDQHYLQQPCCASHGYHHTKEMCLTSNIYIHKYPKLKSQTYMHIQLILPCISKFQFSPLSNNFFQFSPWLVDKRRKRKEPAIGSEGLGKFSDKHRVHHFVFALPDCRVYGFAAFGSHHHQSPSSAAVDVATRRMDY